MITASAPGFVDGPATGTVVQPAVEIVALPTSVSAAAAITPFYVQVGLANVEPDGAAVGAERAGPGRR